MKASKKTIKTYCYGKLRQFKTRKQARMFYQMGVYSSEGAERDRYVDILAMLDAGKDIAFDCDGIPAEKPKVNAPTADERTALLKRKEELSAKKTARYADLDAIREVIAEKRRAFEETIKDLTDRESLISDECSEMAFEMIRIERKLDGID